MKTDDTELTYGSAKELADTILANAKSGTFTADWDYSELDECVQDIQVRDYVLGLLLMQSPDESRALISAIFDREDWHSRNPAIWLTYLAILDYTEKDFQGALANIRKALATDEKYSLAGLVSRLISVAVQDSCLFSDFSLMVKELHPKVTRELLADSGHVL